MSWFNFIPFMPGCHIQLDILPKTIRLENSRHVTLRCSLDLILARTEKVYSIMFKKGEAPVVVLLQDRIEELTERKYNITGSVTTISSSAVFLQLFLDKVTCLDRGNYSCSMAVKRLGKAATMGPVISRLEIKGQCFHCCLWLCVWSHWYFPCYKVWIHLGTGNIHTQCNGVRPTCVVQLTSVLHRCY